MSNELYDFLKRSAGWVGRDGHSRAKFVQEIRERFDLPSPEALRVADWMFWAYENDREEFNRPSGYAE
jgi:hypothetical protein